MDLPAFVTKLFLQYRRPLYVDDYLDCSRRNFVIVDIFWMLVKIEDVDDENSQKRHQHPKVVTNA